MILPNFMVKNCLFAMMNSFNFMQISFYKCAWCRYIYLIGILFLSRISSLRVIITPSTFLKKCSFTKHPFNDRRILMKDVRRENNDVVVWSKGAHALQLIASSYPLPQLAKYTHFIRLSPFFKLYLFNLFMPLLI